jgi:hypothetical protein
MELKVVGVSLPQQFEWSLKNPFDGIERHDEIPKAIAIGIATESIRWN